MSFNPIKMLMETITTVPYLYNTTQYSFNTQKSKTKYITYLRNYGADPFCKCKVVVEFHIIFFHPLFINGFASFLCNIWLQTIPYFHPIYVVLHWFVSQQVKTNCWCMALLVLLYKVCLWRTVEISEWEREQKNNHPVFHQWQT